ALCIQDWKQRLVCTLHETLAVVVEYWCQEHSKLNKNLVEKGMEDLAEHISILCQDRPPEFFQEFIPSMPSMKLRMLTADSIYRNFCRRNGIIIGTEPLTLKKIVSYWMSVEKFTGCPPTSQPWGGSAGVTHKLRGQAPGREAKRELPAVPASWSDQGEWRQPAGTAASPPSACHS
ncbi:hypothetical protein Z043_102518, partial [Scleropages formosus]